MPMNRNRNRPKYNKLKPCKAMITKDGRDTPIEKLTPDNYIVPKGEEKDYHAVIEVVQYDPKTGKKISKPRVQKFGRKTFESHVFASLRKQGYEITILHDPNDWIKAQQAKAAERAKENAAAEKAKFDAAVDAAVSEKLDAAVAAAVAKALAEAKDQQEQEPAAEQAKKPGRPAKESKE